MNTLPVPDYGPPPGDHLKLAGVTLRAVDMIGERTATEIAEAAAGLRAGAEQVAGHLDQLAQAIRDHTKVAAGHVAEFLDRSEQVLTTVRALQAQLSEGADAHNGHGG